MGWPKSLKHNRPEGQSGRRSEGLPKKQAPARQLLRPTSPTGALASDISRLRAVSPIGRPGPKRCFLLRPHVSDRGPVGSLLTALLRLARLGPTGGARSEGTRGERRRQRTKSNHDTGTIPCMPAGTVLLNRPDTNSIVGADICVYSIVGTVGSHTTKSPLHVSRHR